MIKGNKSRLLYMYRYLMEHTDADHPVSTQELIDIMSREYGVGVTRITVADDVNTLQDAGYNIEVIKSRQNKYYFDDFLFDTAELKVLIDAVSSARFITEKNSKDLIAKLLSLTSEHERSRLRRHVTVDGRVRSENALGYYIVDAVNEAIDKNCKVCFRYTDFDMKKRRVPKNNGEVYSVSPYALVWDGDYYYMIGWCDNRAEMRHFRLDRIYKTPEIRENEPQVSPPEGFVLSAFLKQVFRMYGSADAVEVELLCADHTMNSVIDQFGAMVRTEEVDDHHFKAYVNVSPSPTFYRWVFGWNGDMKILGPEGVKEAYKEMARKALED